MNEEFFAKLKEKIQPYFEEGGSHEFSHTQRVYNLALKIAKQENTDLDILKAAALLHDISRMKQDNNEVECHARDGAEKAKEILEQFNFQKDKIPKVAYAIRVHRHSTGIIPETIEAKILQDADRLDALGAITIGRMFSSGGKTNIPMHNPALQKKEKQGYGNTVINGFNNKILKLKPETFHTKKAKEIAKERYEFVKEFLGRFLKEWGGEL